MGACCSSSRGERFEGFMVEERRNERPIRARNENDHKQNAENCGPRVRFEGSSRFISMYTQQGRKGINQDAMTVWEVFNPKNSKKI